MEEGHVLGSLIHGTTGSGKTALLKLLVEHYAPRSCYLDVNYLNPCDKNFTVEALILRWFDNAVKNDKNVILIDNVDAPLHNYNISNTSSAANYSFVLRLFPQILEKRRIKSPIKVYMTSSTVEGTDPYVLTSGNCLVFSIQKPNANQRRSMISNMIDLVCQDDIESSRLDIIVSQTQGYNLADLVSLVREVYFDNVITQGASTNVNMDNFKSTALNLRSATMAPDLTSSSVVASKLSSLMQTRQDRYQTQYATTYNVIMEALEKAANRRQTQGRLFSAMTQQSSDMPNPTKLIGIDSIMTRVQQLLLGDEIFKATIPPNLLHRLSQLDIPTSSGFIFHGPSGSGKTVLAQHVAATVRHRFRCLSLACTDLVHKVVGESEKTLETAFIQAREMAPCILILDNLDIILGSPSQYRQFDENYQSNSTNISDTMYYDNIREVDDEMNSNSKECIDDYHNLMLKFRRDRTSHAAIDRLLSTLLVEIDGLRIPLPSKPQSQSFVIEGEIANAGGKVIVIATATDLTLLDRALRRPGRLEEHIELTLPCLQQRKEYFQNAIPVLDENDATDLATATENKSYADLQVFVRSATMRVLRAAVMAKTASNSPTADICSNNECPLGSLESTSDSDERKAYGKLICANIRHELFSKEVTSV